MFTWGANTCGQCGHGDSVDRSLPQQITSLPFQGIHHVAGGANHALLLDDQYQLWGCGSFARQQWQPLSVNDHVSQSLVWQRAVSPITLHHDTMLYCGWASSMILIDKQLWYSGNGLHWTQVLIDNENQFDQFSHASVSVTHCLVVLSDDKSLYWWSEGKGVSTSTVFAISQERVNAIATGRHASTWITLSGQIYFANHKKTVTIHVIDASFGEIRQLSMGWHAVYVVTKANQLFAWGRNNLGQLGHQCHSDCRDHSLEPVLVMENVDIIATGAEYVLVKPLNLGLFAFGWNEHGHCGTRAVPEPIEWTPRPVLFENKECNIACGYGFSIIY